MMKVKCLLNKKQNDKNRAYCNATHPDVSRAIGYCGSVMFLAKKTGYSEHYIRSIQFGHSKMTQDFKEAIENIYIN